MTVDGHQVALGDYALEIEMQRRKLLRKRADESDEQLGMLRQIGVM